MTPAVTNHPGFKKALADCGKTASEAMAIISAVEAVEGSALETFQSREDADQVLRPLLEEPPSYSTRPASCQRTGSAHGFQQELRSPSQSSSSVKSSGCVSNADTLDATDDEVQPETAE